MVIYIKIMNQGVKEPNVKLIPSDPMTNSILIIYCVSSGGVSVPFKSQWRRINKKRNLVQQINTHNGTSYRCSPLDIECFLEVTITFTFQNLQMQKVVQSNMVKVSRELKERRNYLKENIVGKITIDQVVLEAQFYVQEESLYFSILGQGQRSIAINIREVLPETQNNQHSFKLFFKNNPGELLYTISQIISLPLQLKHGFILFTFVNDFNRDIILLGIAEVFLHNSLLRSSKPQHSYLVSKTPEKQYHKNEFLQRERPSQNKSQTSLSPAQTEKAKVVEQNALKKSFTNVNRQGINNVSIKDSQSSTTLKNAKEKEKPKEKQKEKQKERQKERQKQKQKSNSREYLNVFQDQQDLQFLNYNPKITSMPKTPPIFPKKTQQSKDQPAINLRESFQQLQKSFSNINEDTIEKMFNSSMAETHRLQQNMAVLKKQNDILKKQCEMMVVISKENHNLKRKYHELKEEINRLQIQRKTILTDKIRCEVSWHKEMQEKEVVKKELQGLKQFVKNNYPVNNQMGHINMRGSGNINYVISNMNMNMRESGNNVLYNPPITSYATQKHLSPQNQRLKNNSYYEMSSTTQRKLDAQVINRSPNASFYQNK